MKWSLRVGRFASIDVYMHVTFLLLVSWVALMYYRQGHSIVSAMVGVAFILAVFLCVVLHEFSHALTARRYGIKTRDTDGGIHRAGNCYFIWLYWVVL